MRKPRNNRAEGILQLAILHYLRVRGYKAGKTKTTGIKYGNVYHTDPYLFLGFPDVTVFTPELVFIECKSPIGKQNVNQKLFAKYCKEAGIKYILARTIDDVMRVI